MNYFFDRYENMEQNLVSVQNIMYAILWYESETIQCTLCVSYGKLKYNTNTPSYFIMQTTCICVGWKLNFYPHTHRKCNTCHARLHKCNTQRVLDTCQSNLCGFDVAGFAVSSLKLLEFSDVWTLELNVWTREIRWGERENHNNNNNT